MTDRTTRVPVDTRAPNPTSDIPSTSDATAQPQTNPTSPTSHPHHPPKSPTSPTAEELLAKCVSLAYSQNILDEILTTVQALGVVGEERSIKLLYLAMTSRLLKRPISILVKGPSASGKSHATQKTITLFPPSAYHEMSGMSEKALVYFREPLSHRMLIVFEAAGLGPTAEYFIRSLLSEGRIRYSVTIKVGGEFRTKDIRQDGPTGLVLTTTDISVHPENETRMLSLTSADTPEQTQRILEAQATEDIGRALPDLTVHHAFQNWLTVSERRVTVPYALKIAQRIPQTDIRIRRDFPMVLSLIHSHAILHQLHRKRKDDGVIIANLEDYRVIRDLVNDYLSDGLDTMVSPEIRETVQAVADLRKEDRIVGGIHVKARLGIHKASASRRIADAIKRGFLINDESNPQKPQKLRLGIPLPHDTSVLPSVEDIDDGCAVAPKSEG